MSLPLAMSLAPVAIDPKGKLLPGGQRAEASGFCDAEAAFRTGVDRVLTPGGARSRRQSLGQGQGMSARGGSAGQVFSLVGQAGKVERPKVHDPTGYNQRLTMRLVTYRPSPPV